MLLFTLIKKISFVFNLPVLCTSTVCGFKDTSIKMRSGET